MSTTYKDYKKDLEKALSLLEKVKDKETKIMAALMIWETRIAKKEIEKIKEDLGL